MAPMKISDTDLENLRCQCGQYLSKPPIYIQNGQNHCGDCVDLLAPEPLEATRNASWEILASYFCFPCRYKPQGCPIYMKFHEVSNHETMCSHRTISCPFNEHSLCDWHGTISQLQLHYRSQHPELFLTSSNAKVRINEDYEEYRVVMTDVHPFLLYTKCEIQNDKLWFNIICFTTAANAGLINCSVNLSNKINSNASLTLDGEMLPFSDMGNKPRLCVKISNLREILQSAESVDCSWIINLTKEFKAEFKNQLDREKLAAYEAQKEITKCLGCEIYTVPPIKRCGEGHVMCVDCRGYYDHCKICDKNVTFAIATELEAIAKNGHFECKWRNCNATSSSTEIRQHERICSKRIYTCPECNVWLGLHDQIESHFKSVHKVILLLHNTVQMFTLEEYGVIYFFTCHEFFKLIANKSEVTIQYCGSPRFVDIWEIYGKMGFQFLGNGKTSNNNNQYWHLYSSNKKKNQISIIHRYSAMPSGFGQVPSLPMQMRRGAMYR